MSDIKKKINLSQYRLEKAKETYLTAFDNLAGSKYLDANNRAYYSIFHSMRALLALDGVDFKRHSGVISYFREKYIKTNIFDDKYSDIIGKASVIRGKSDYEDFYIASKDEAIEQVDNAKIFYEAVADYIKNHIAEYTR
ncbi:MAG: HEPN domain-containing protein [Clostridiales bacterium]|nr:HEPN domain-containing protein [Clostridiales bacterium]